MDLRCERGHLHAKVLPDGRLEVSCRSRFCGAEQGVVVLHRFDLSTGEVTTRRYKDPATKEKEEA